jgi:hypothetical protein
MRIYCTTAIQLETVNIQEESFMSKTPNNVAEENRWIDGIYQLEVTDPVQGGPDGIDNVQAKQLASRTQFLKTQIAAAVAAQLAHANEFDPHPQYLLPIEAQAAFAPKTHSHPEIAALAASQSAHANEFDPHPQYLLPSEAQAAFAPKDHSHPAIVPAPKVKQVVTDLGLGAAAIDVPPATVPANKSSYSAFIHGSTGIENVGYHHHVSFGAYRTGVANWNGGAYIAIGTGSDLNPTEAYHFELGGKLTHSSGRAYVSNFDLPIIARRSSYTTADSVTINNASNEHGFDYNTSGSGVIGSFFSFGGFGDFNSSAKNSYQCQIQAGYATGQSIKFRTRNGDTDAWNGWRDIIHSSNIETYLRNLTTPIFVNSPTNPLGGSIAAFTSTGAYGGGYRMIDGDKHYLIYADSGRFNIAMRTGDSGVYSIKFSIGQNGVASTPFGDIHTTGSLNKVSQLANDCGYLSATPVLVQQVNLDAATAPGSYTANYGMATSGVQTFNFGGSVGQVQLAFHYLGALQYRNRIDSSTWSSWKDVHTNASLTKLSQLANDIGVFPSGTRMPFAQSVAPVGWTQDTSDATNNRMLRVVNTAGGNTGGTHSPIINNIVPSHTHSFTTGGQSRNHSHGVNDPGHAHGGGETTQQNLVDGTKGAFVRLNYQPANPTGLNTTGITLGNETQDHNHSGTTNANAGAENWQPRYIDMIICIRN